MAGWLCCGAGGVAFLVGQNFSVGGVGSIAINARRGERLAVGPGTVAVEGNQVYGAIGNDIVEDFFSGKSGGGERGIGPAHALNPGVVGLGGGLGGMSVGVGFDALLDFGDGGGAVQIDAR